MDVLEVTNAIIISIVSYLSYLFLLTLSSYLVTYERSTIMHSPHACCCNLWAPPSNYQLSRSQPVGLNLGMYLYVKHTHVLLFAVLQQKLPTTLHLHTTTSYNNLIRPLIGTPFSQHKATCHYQLAPKIFPWRRGHY